MKIYTRDELEAKVEQLEAENKGLQAINAQLGQAHEDVQANNRHLKQLYDDICEQVGRKICTDSPQPVPADRYFRGYDPGEACYGTRGHHGDTLLRGPTQYDRGAAQQDAIAIHKQAIMDRLRNDSGADTASAYTVKDCVSRAASIMQEEQQKYFTDEQIADWARRFGMDMMYMDTLRHMFESARSM